MTMIFQLLAVNLYKRLEKENKYSKIVGRDEAIDLELFESIIKTWSKEFTISSPSHINQPQTNYIY